MKHNFKTHLPPALFVFVVAVVHHVPPPVPADAAFISAIGGTP